MFHVPEKCRVIEGPMKSLIGSGNNGCFAIALKKKDIQSPTVITWVIASDGSTELDKGWEHVSVSINRNRTPTWEVMCFVKNTFWDEKDCVIQYHPPKESYVNNHPFCLHLWRLFAKYYF